MPVVRVMQVAVDEVVDVIAMRYRLVSAPVAVLVICLVAVAGVIGGTDRGIGIVDGDHMLVHMILMRTVQVPVVQVVDMIAVLDGDMAAVRTVDVVVVAVDRVIS